MAPEIPDISPAAASPGDVSLDKVKMFIGELMLHLMAKEQTIAALHQRVAELTPKVAE